MSEYKYQWKHPDNEEPKAVCYDCGLPYEEFQDMVVPNDIWELISPTNFKGAGLLCPTCMANRLAFLDLWYGNHVINIKNR